MLFLLLAAVQPHGAALELALQPRDEAAQLQDAGQLHTFDGAATGTVFDVESAAAIDLFVNETLSRLLRCDFEGLAAPPAPPASMTADLVLGLRLEQNHTMQSAQMSEYDLAYSTSRGKLVLRLRANVSTHHDGPAIRSIVISRVAPLEFFPPCVKTMQAARMLNGSKRVSRRLSQTWSQSREAALPVSARARAGLCLLGLLFGSPPL